MPFFGGTELYRQVGTNIKGGTSALANLTSGQFNLALGQNALSSASSAQNNIAIGYNAGESLTIGASNIIVGVDALSSSLLSSESIAIGYRALKSSLTPNSNIAIGYEAFMSLATGSSNTAIGTGAANSLSNGDDNVLIGFLSGNGYTVNTVRNTNVGSLSGASGTIGADNTLIGYGAGNFVSSYNNTIVGSLAGDEIQNGHDNIIIGYKSGFGIGDVSHHIIIGDNTATSITIGGIPFTGGGGVTAFTGLSDVPHSYAGAAHQIVSVNAAQTGLEFVNGVDVFQPAGANFNPFSATAGDATFATEYADFIVTLGANSVSHAGNAYFDLGAQGNAGVATSDLQAESIATDSAADHVFLDFDSANTAGRSKVHMLADPTNSLFTIDAAFGALTISASSNGAIGLKTDGAINLDDNSANHIADFTHSASNLFSPLTCHSPVTVVGNNTLADGSTFLNVIGASVGGAVSESNFTLSAVDGGSVFSQLQFIAAVGAFAAGFILKSENNLTNMDFNAGDFSITSSGNGNISVASNQNLSLSGASSATLSSSGNVTIQSSTAATIDFSLGDVGTFTFDSSAGSNFVMSGLDYTGATAATFVAANAPAAISPKKWIKVVIGGVTGYLPWFST